MEGSAAPVNYLSDLFLFDNLGNVDITASTHRALPRLHFAFIHPFMSTLQTYPLCHTLQLHSNLNIYIKALNFFPSQRSICCRELLGLKASPSSIRFVGSYNINFFRYKRYFFAAFGAFTIVSLNYLVWRFQFCAFVENKTAFFANYLLRHGLTAIVDRNTNVTNYLYITTKRRNALENPFRLFMMLPFCEL